MKSVRQWIGRGGTAALLAMVALQLMPVEAVGQQADQARVAAQKAAMQKLAFLVGTWSGPATVLRGAMEPLKLTQTEKVEWKLDGLVLEIEGAGANADGRKLFTALATVAYDDAAKAYHIRAYHDGQYLDTELTVKDGGFAWGFAAGPVHVDNTMHLTPTGEWYETTEFVMGNASPRRSMEMTLTRQP